jgi:thioester reductase-like protein
MTASAKPASDVTLVTGFPDFSARRLVQTLLQRDKGEVVYLLAASTARSAAHAFITALDPKDNKRVRILEGNVADMDLGLRGAEYKNITTELTCIHHAQSLYHTEGSRELVERVNIGGTKTIVELAGDCKKLRRLVHWSNASVAGNRVGVVMEDELDAGQRFHNFFEETRFAAESLVQAASRKLPITILRPSLVLGDSQTGELSTADNAYYFLAFVISAELRLSIAVKPSSPLHVVPVDFVVAAAAHLGKSATAVGKTFHLTDPSPFSVGNAFALIAKAGEKKQARASLSADLARALLRPAGDKLKAPRALLDGATQLCLFNSRNASKELRAADIACPSFDTYVEPLVRFVRGHAGKHTATKMDDEPSDPLA